MSLAENNEFNRSIIIELINRNKDEFIKFIPAQLAEDKRDQFTKIITFGNNKIQ